MLRPDILIILIFLLPVTLCGSRTGEYIVRDKYFGIEDGLAHRNVQSLYQDQEGFLWLGTKGGLQRFDGYGFVTYSKASHDLQSNDISHIQADARGRLWLFEGIGKLPNTIDIFDPLTGRVQSLDRTFPGDVPFSPGEIINFGVNDSGKMVFLTRDNRLVHYEREFRTVQIDPGPYRDVSGLQLTENGDTWIVFTTMPARDGTTSARICVFDGEGREIRRIEPRGDYDFIHIYQLREEGSCRFIAGKYNRNTYRFYSADPSGSVLPDRTSESTFGRFDPLFDQLSRLSTFTRQHELYWVHIMDTFSIYSPESGFSVDLTERRPDLRFTNDILFGRAGKVWIGTQFGLYQMELRPNHFQRIMATRDGSLNPVRRMLMDHTGQLWVVKENEKGIWRVRFPDGCCGNPGAVPFNSTLPADKKLTFPSLYYTLVLSPAGEVCYGTYEAVVCFDPVTAEGRKLDFSIRDGTDHPVWAMDLDDEGKIWFANDRGEVGFTHGSGSKTLPRLDPGVTFLHVYQFFSDRNGTTWLATQGGLFTLSTREARITGRYWKGGEGEYRFPFGNIHHIHQDKDGSFWLATGGSGLIHWMPGHPGYEQYTIEDGLPNNTLYAIYEDNHQNLWMSSDYGIIRFHKINHSTKTYLEKDGITHHEFNRISHYRHTDGTIFFGGLNGITAFHPDDFKSDSTTFDAPFAITEFLHYIGKEDRLVDKTRELTQTRSVTMAPGDPFFHLEFALLTYEQRDKIRYAYKIEGVDADWIFQKENFIRLNRLPYGEHRLRIKGQNAEGHWSSRELLITVRVLRPFYLTGWFAGGMLLFIVFTTYVIYKLRLRNLKARQVDLEQLVAERTQKITEDKMVIEQQAEELRSLERLKSRFFANVSHELRTPLTLMLGPVNSLLKKSGIRENDRKLLRLVQRNAVQLKTLITELLDLSKMESGKLTVEYEQVALYPWLKEQMVQYASFAEMNDLKCTLDIDPDDSPVIMMDKKKVENILRNFLSNAIKFTPPGGTIDVAVVENEESIEIRVKDTGQGIHPDDLPHIFDRFFQSGREDAPMEGGTGIGLAYCKELASLLGGRVRAESQLGRGSTFFIEIPKEVAIDQAHGSLRAPAVGSGMQSSPEPAPKQKRSVILPGDGIQSSDLADQTILVVEDNADLREYIAYLLSDYSVATASNGREALDLLESGLECQLIVSDLMMPVMDGQTFVQHLKNDARWQPLPVIMLTAKTNIRSRIQSLRIGVDDYLTKPFEEEELLTRIDNIIRNVRRRVDGENMAPAVQTSPQKDPSPTRKNNLNLPSDFDLEWLVSIETLAIREVSSGLLTVPWLAGQMHISERQLYRRLKKLTGLTPNQYLREIRLQEARNLLEEKKVNTVKEAAAKVRFKDEKYFSRLFQGRFGKYPSELLS